ncbi:MAG: iron-sulfur cluster assembly scaffold protein, partial [Phycisphaerae bacterium]
APYSDAVMDHFRRPRNVGELEDANGIGTAGAESCGDVMRIWIRVTDEHIEEVRFKCRGCPTAIACGSVVTELAKGKHIDDADAITADTVETALGGLSEEKRHCSNLGAEALGEAIWDYIHRDIDAGGPDEASQKT